MNGTDWTPARIQAARAMIAKHNDPNTKFENSYEAHEALGDAAVEAFPSLLDAIERLQAERDVLVAENRRLQNIISAKAFP